MKILRIFLPLLTLSDVFAAAMLPSPLLKLDDYFSHHVIVVEKSTHKLHLYRNGRRLPRIGHDHENRHRQKARRQGRPGRPQNPGGRPTNSPNFSPTKTSSKDTANRAKSTASGPSSSTYPNPIDRKGGKTGSGIWIHSTNDEARIDLGLESRGCIVTANDKLIELSHYIELHKTSIVVVHNLHFISEEAWTTERNNILGVLDRWADAWRNERSAEYFSHYHPSEFRDPVRGNFPQFRQHKSLVFSRPGKPSIRLSDISIIRTDRYAVVSFRQEYKSGSIDDAGKKLLYMKRDDHYNWKIVSEVWTKLGIDPDRPPN